MDRKEPDPATSTKNFTFASLIVLFLLLGTNLVGSGRVKALRTVDSVPIDNESILSSSKSERGTQVGEEVWKVRSPEGVGVSIDLPGEPQPQKLPIPDALQPLIRDWKHFLYYGRNWAVTIDRVQLVRADSLRNCAEGIVKGIIEQGGGSDLTYNVEPHGENNIQIMGQYRIPDGVVAFDGILAGSGTH
ncbi:MAG: hypothetical protein ACRD2L_10520, partial [Terriglobia bacterium]